MNTIPPTLSTTLRQVAQTITGESAMAQGDRRYLEGVADDLDRGCAAPDNVDDAIAIAREYQ